MQDQQLKNWLILRILFLISFFLVQITTLAQYNTSSFRTAGTASTLNDTCFQLTFAKNNQSGSVWYNTPIDLRQNFTIEASINLGNLDSNGADGMAFVLQENADIVGGTGGGLGYGGIHPSLAIEFDTWQNDDPPYDHIALVKNGVIFHYLEPDNTLQGPFELLPGGANAEDGRFRDIKISWEAATQRLRCYYNGSLKIDYQSDIVRNIFNGNSTLYWGFTAATEGYFNDQSICLKKPNILCSNQKIHIPNAFTPNGDHLNDMFYPLGENGTLIRSLKIFNRWGQMIWSKQNFSANDKNYAWDGKFKGELQPPGLYPYFIELDCGEGQTQKLKGTITLLR